MVENGWKMWVKDTKKRAVLGVKSRFLEAEKIRVGTQIEGKNGAKCSRSAEKWIKVVVRKTENCG